MVRRLKGCSPGAIAALLALAGTLAVGACGGEDEGDDPFTSDGFGRAVDAVAEEVGEDADLFVIQITGTGVNFSVAEDEEVRGLLYTGGDLREVQVDVFGPVATERFPLADVDPAAIDRIVDGVREQSHDDDVMLQAISLHRGRLDGELGWVINARGGSSSSGGSLVYLATPDGTVELADPNSARRSVSRHF